MEIGDRVVLEYTMADTHYWPATVIETDGLKDFRSGRDRVVIELDTQPDILTTKVLTVATKHLFIRHKS